MQRFLLFSQMLLSLYLCSLSVKGFASLAHAGSDISSPMYELRSALRKEFPSLTTAHEDIDNAEQSIRERCMRRLEAYGDHAIKTGIVGDGMLVVCVMQMFSLVAGRKPMD